MVGGTAAKESTRTPCEKARSRTFFGLTGLVAWLLFGGGGAVQAQRTIEVPATPRLLETAEETIFTVGAVDGPEHELFGEVTGIAFGPDGSLHVLDRANARVVVFDPDGSLRHTLGGEGGGPGEFRFPVGLAVDGAGNVWVGDLMGRTLKVFGPDGALVRTARVGVEGRADFATLTAADPGLALVRDRNENARAGMVSVYAVAVDGDISEMTRVDVPFVPGMEQSGTTFRRIAAPVFTPTLRMAALPDGRLASVHDADYSVAVVGADGVDARIVADGLDPASVTESDRENEKERRRELNRERRDDPPAAVGGFQVRVPDEAELEASLERLRFAERHAVVRNLDASPEGMIWIQRWDGSPWGPAPIDLVSVGQGYVGTLPAREMPDAVGPRGRVAYVRTDDLDVERVEVIRIEVERGTR